MADDMVDYFGSDVSEEEVQQNNANLTADESFEEVYEDTRFCKYCKNITYPKENKETQELYMACRHCDFQVKAKNSRVFYHQIQYVPPSMVESIEEEITDGTLPITDKKPCPKCKSTNAAYFQSRSRRPDSTMALNYVCLNKDCHWSWTS
ncbi:DNA-directed RNA polymerase II subunit RPB9, partial [Conidiobolus coronatus NRRL 28638]